jgi:hypothetical protein
VKRLFCILFCLSLLGCTQNKSKVPDNLVQENEMVQILADIHTAEARVENNVVYPDTAMMAFNYLQSQILKKHGVTQKQFERTYRYYLNHLEEMDKLYEVIVDTLSLRESKAALIPDTISPKPALKPATPLLKEIQVE